MTTTGIYGDTKNLIRTKSNEGKNRSLFNRSKALGVMNENRKIWMFFSKNPSLRGVTEGLLEQCWEILCARRRIDYMKKWHGYAACAESSFSVTPNISFSLLGVCLSR
jgi:hypothetical protein